MSSTLSLVADPPAQPVSAAAPEELRSPSGPKPFWKKLASILAGLLAVYIFIVGIEIMGGGLKAIADIPANKATMASIFHLADYPLAGLCIGVLLTSLVQSSSFTTSFTVGLVATGQLPLAPAVFVIMGANIGTSVTNTLVSLAHLRRRKEFERSLHAATVHDFFNVLAVMLLLPLEWSFGLISRPAVWLSDTLGGAVFFKSANPKNFHFVKTAVRPIGDFLNWILGSVLNFSPTFRGVLVAVIGTIMLFVALVMLVKILRSMMEHRLAGLFSKTLFRSQPVSFVVGLFTTAAVQSSSVTTSLVVPLVGAGVLKTRQIFPYTLGANIGTTVTAMLCALAASALALAKGPKDIALAEFALAAAFAHLLFNLFGTAVFWPLQWIPLSLSKGFAKLASRRRILAAVYIVAFFFVIPALVILVVNSL